MWKRLLVACALFTCSSCSWFSKAVPVVEQAAIDCGKAAIAAELPQIGGQIVAVLLAGGNVAVLLDALAANGMDAVVCAVEAIANAFDGAALDKASDSQSTTSETEAASGFRSAALAGHLWVASKNVKLTHVAVIH
jgi:hypothetical protein